MSAVTAPPFVGCVVWGLIGLIVNYIKRRSTYTTHRNHTSSQHQFKTGIPQGGVLSPTLFNIYTADIPLPRSPVQVMVYAADITINLHTQARVQSINTYIHSYIKWLPEQNNLTLNPDKLLALCSLQTMQNIRAIWTSK